MGFDCDLYFLANKKEEGHRVGYIEYVGLERQGHSPFRQPTPYTNLYRLEFNRSGTLTAQFEAASHDSGLTQFIGPSHPFGSATESALAKVSVPDRQVNEE